MTNWPHHFGPVAQCIVGEAHGGRGLFTSWLGTKKKRRRDQSHAVPSKDTCPVF
jgi:hypothetical protein